MKLFPSLLSADFSCLQKSLQPLIEAGMENFHLDIMDGHFVPNISYGPPVVKTIVDRFPGLNWDAHLMMENPRLLFETFLELGVDSISIHAEIEADINYFKRLSRDYNSKLGLVLNPDTPVEPHSRKISEVDYLLLMAVQPGFGGQSFQDKVLAKIEKIKAFNRCPLQIDGGINEKSITKAARAGIDWFVAGSAIFAAADPGQEAKKLIDLASKN